MRGEACGKEMNPPIIKDPPLGRSGLAKLVAELKRQGRIVGTENSKRAPVQITLARADYEKIMIESGVWPDEQ